MAVLPVKLAFKTLSNKTPSSQKCGNVIVAHGLLGNAANWTSASRRLLTHPSLTHCLRDVCMLDMRNHGSSPHTPDHSNNALASDVEAFVLRMQQRPCDHMQADLRGCSMGFTDSVDSAATVHSKPFADCDGGTIVIGHSMGGLAVISMLLRRYNESLFLSDHANDGQVSLSLDEDVRAISSAMSGVNRLYGFDEMQPIQDVLFDNSSSISSGTVANESGCDDHRRHDDMPRAVCKTNNGRIKAAIIVDVTPNSLDEAFISLPHNQSTIETLRAMTAVDMTRIHSYDEARVALERAGITDTSLREFVMTNIVLDKDRIKAARWRCNLSALTHGKLSATVKPTTVSVLQHMLANQATHDWVRQVRPCTLPVLFVFGANSPYNIAVNRACIAPLFPNSTQLEVAGAGHFVHYENLSGFVDAVAPFIRQHLCE